VRPVNRFGLDIHCPACEHPVVKLNGTANGSLTVAILECTGCRKQYELTARLNPHHSPDLLQDYNRRNARQWRERQRA
jgi:transposase-like protein